jgi:hypothetical protein
MRLLVKFPTRGRAGRFLLTLRGWIEQMSKPEDVVFLVSCDADDPTMTDGVIAQAKALHPNVTVVRGNSKSKIEACNADIGGYVQPWNVLLLVSDDMWCSCRGWDKVIRTKMAELYPDTDGCLWLHDGSAQRLISTLSCMGRRFYDRFGYIYHPSYKSFWSDNEYTDVARSLGKMTFIEPGIAFHEHPSWRGGMKVDATYQRNRGFWRQDETNYNRRKALGFPA